MNKLKMMVFMILVVAFSAFWGGTDDVCAQDTTLNEPLVDTLAGAAGRIKPSAQKAAAASIEAARAAAQKRAWKNGYVLPQSIPPGPGDQPDYYTVPNWANTPPIRKFVDSLPPMGCAGTNDLGQCIPVAEPDRFTYPGSDYYEIGLVEYHEQMNADLPLPGTTLRGYYQINDGRDEQGNVISADHSSHHLGPIIIAQRGRPVRIKFTNELPTGAGGDLFVPVDTTVMGAGDFDINFDPETKEYPVAENEGVFTQNRATLHLHGGRTPWISDGTPQQWIAPAAEITTYPKGVSVTYVPDMWFDASGNTIASCAGQTECLVGGATNNPGPGSMTFYWTNQQSARLMFYHDHAWGTTRQDVYVGEAAGYLIEDAWEHALINGGQANGTGRVYDADTIPADQIPLILEDKTFVDANPASPTYVRKTDPTWQWGSGPPDSNGYPTPVTGDLWWPHVYMPAQNPYAPDGSGINAMGRWHYGPWFYPPTPVCGSSPDAVAPFCVKYGTEPNLYYDPTCDPEVAGFCQPPEIPGTPNVSWGAEAFLDTPTVNGTAYPYLVVDPKPYRFRILNASHDRFFNLQFYKPSAIVSKINVTGGGRGYTEPPAVIISGGGTGATATATIADGVITGITVTNGGSGYTSFANVGITGDGLGATATATMSGGAVDSITVDNGGSGYTIANVTITGDGTGATAAATINSGVVTAINLDTVGSGYPTAPSVTIGAPPGGGTQAVATAEVWTDPTEVGMVPAVQTTGFPTNWPKDSREGGVPDPATSGPAWIQIGTDSGFLPAPVLIRNHPIMWNLDVTMFNYGNILPLAEGGGTLILGPAERADVIVDFSKYAGQTLILYNDAPTAYPALDPHYDYYTGAPDRTDMGGAPAIPPGVAPNVRTVMQIRVNPGADSSAPANDYDPAVLARLQNAFQSTTGNVGGTPGVFEADQDPIVVGQAAYDSTYNMTFPTTWPNWGISRISDYALSFMNTNGTLVSNFAMEPKAIHDEMGAAFDEYGRMSAKLGLTVQFANAATATFALQNYVDPATEIIPEGATQIWRITHNGVDTHPVHFHLFDVQLINRVGWDGFIRLPDANERGWKDTIRTSPLEDTIVALRPSKPDVPFTVPDSYRPLNPAAPVNVGNQDGFSQVDPTTAGPLAEPQTNVMVNFGWEYVWHCHILSHEENDMMRPIIFDVPDATPAAPTDLTATSVDAPVGGIGQQVELDWTKGVPATPNRNTEIGYHIERCAGSGCDNFTSLVELPSSAATTYTDTLVVSGTTYRYQVKAYNALGDGPASNMAEATPEWSIAAGVDLTDSPLTPSQAGNAVLFTAQCLDGGSNPIPCLYRFSRDGVIVKDYGDLGVPNTWILPATTPPGTYAIRVDVTTDPVSLASLAHDTINHQLSGGVRLYDSVAGYSFPPSVANAFAGAQNTDSIDAWGVQFNELPITFSPEAVEAVTFRGGWDNIFTLRTGMTSLQGPLTIGGNGTLTVENLTIR